MDGGHIIDTSGLTQILEIDTERMVAVVEANVPMDRLVKETMKQNLVPLVVPEFPGITVGGAFSGTAGESSSFKFGYFDRTVNSFEIILANGEITTATPSSKNSDLFNGAAGACGTLGVLTLFEVQLMRAKRFVELTYLPVTSGADAIATLKSCSTDSALNFVDAILFSQTAGVVCIGRLTDQRVHNLQTFSGPWDPWFYMHARSRAIAGSGATPKTDTIPLADYLFRYDRGAFWMGSYYPLFFISFMNNMFLRWLFDSFLRTRALFQSLHISNRSQKFIIQDLGLPLETSEDFLKYVDSKFNIYPLWLCPLSQDRVVNLQRVRASELTINFGVWGPGPSDFSSFVAQNRDLEAKLRELGGAKWLYAHTYYTRDEFWQIYDREEYESVRTKYSATTLPDIYTKVKSDEVSYPRRDLMASWHGLCAHLLGYKIPYLLWGPK
ncbi:hypothetical protein K3495_g11075 [Podosphaera aphanis]|nr:hypothetical protein K3495_g11075 [Podosphaera aphanis]